MRYNSLFTLVVVGLSACAGSPARIGMDSPQQLQAEKTYNLCVAYGGNRGQAVLDELLRRGVVRPQYVASIKVRKVEIGMSECEVIAAILKPEKVNKTTTVSGTSEQWVYSNSTIFVYLKNGVVEATQN
jgi:hypothetical protein